MPDPMRALFLIPVVLLSACSTDQLDHEFAARKQAYVEKGLTPKAAEDLVFEEFGNFSEGDEANDRLFRR